MKVESQNQIQDIDIVGLEEILMESNNPIDKINQIVNGLSQAYFQNLSVIKNACGQQENRIFNKLREMKQISLYDEMLMINSELDLKNLSGQQLQTKWIDVQSRIKDEGVIEEEESDDLYYQETLPDFEQMDEEHQEEKVNAVSLYEAELANNFLENLQEINKENIVHSKNRNNMKNFGGSKIQNIMAEDYEITYTNHKKSSSSRWGNILKDIDNEEFNYRCLDLI